jgi:ATP-binding cassette subfamily B protein
MSTLREDLFRSLQGKNLSELDTTRTGELVTRTTTDVEALGELLTGGITIAFSGVVTVSLALAVMMYISKPMTIVLVLTMPVMGGIAYGFRTQVRRNASRTREAISALGAIVQESLMATPAIKVLQGEAMMVERYLAGSDDRCGAQLREVSANAKLFPLTRFVELAFLATIVIAGAWFAGAEVVEIGVVIAFVQLSGHVFRPLQDLSDQLATLQAGVAGAERIFAILDPIRAPLVATKRREYKMHSGRSGVAIEFKNVWFAYRPEEWVLRDVTFRVEKGESVAIVGRSGVGKSTVLGLLLGFHVPDRGEVLVDGTLTTDWSLAALRQQFGVVLQSECLFDRTLADNIRFGLENVGRHEMDVVLDMCQLTELVDHLPEGVDTRLLEDGSALSLGGRRRVSLARALLRDRACLLLDEVSSGLDPEAENRLYARLAAGGNGGTTCIAITHDAVRASFASRIVAMDVDSTGMMLTPQAYRDGVETDDGESVGT